MIIWTRLSCGNWSVCVCRNPMPLILGRIFDGIRFLEILYQQRGKQKIEGGKLILGTFGRTKIRTTKGQLTLCRGHQDRPSKRQLSQKTKRLHCPKPKNVNKRFSKILRTAAWLRDCRWLSQVNRWDFNWVRPGRHWWFVNVNPAER